MPPNIPPHRPLRRLLLPLFLCCATFACAQTTVFITCHADCENSDENSPLSPKGECRAAGLSLLLSDANIRAIYVTAQRCAQQTARPVSLLCGVTPETAPDGDADALAAKIKSTTRTGESVLAITQRETVSRLARALGASGIRETGPGEHTRLIAITLFPDGRAGAVAMRYGVECDTRHSHEK